LLIENELQNESSLNTKSTTLMVHNELQNVIGLNRKSTTLLIDNELQNACHKMDNKNMMNINRDFDSDYNEEDEESDSSGWIN